MERSRSHPRTLCSEHIHTKITMYTTYLKHHYNNNAILTQHYDGNVRSDRPFEGDKQLTMQLYTTSTCITPTKMH